MTTLPKGTTVDTSNLQLGELIHMNFELYNVTSIRGFTSMLTVACEKTKMIWIFPTATKLSSVFIIRFTLRTLSNEKYPCKRARVDEYGALKKSTDVTNLIVNEFKISMENTGYDA